MTFFSAMTDSLSSLQRSERMRLIHSQNTKPEWIVRRLTHALGFRYRLHRKDLPGTPDLVFPSKKKVIFVSGCFWHRHQEVNCRLARTPKSKLDYWLPKFANNRRRDLAQQEALTKLGWQFLVIWECETRQQLDVLAQRIRDFLE